MSKELYSRFLSHLNGQLHFAAHSHHFWPDVTREAQLKVWDDAARFNDSKWDHIFSTVVPQVQNHIAKILNLKQADMIALAPNTHDLFTRLFSELLLKKELRLLTTDSEFHSFGRQLQRYREAYPHLKVTVVKTQALLENHDAFVEEFSQHCKGQDVVFISQVFFNSGHALSVSDFKKMLSHSSPETVFVIDGYHGFAALPTDLSELEGRIFYLGGGYKYAQGGEGVGFMVVPQGEWRPVVTGWFAEFSELSSAKQGMVGYAKNGMSFWGATVDPSGWYRFVAAWDELSKQGYSVERIHQQVRSLQTKFLSKAHPLLSTLKPLFTASLPHQGHFLTYEAQSTQKALELRQELSRRGVIIDSRAERLRFGFGLYQDSTDVEELARRLT